MPSTQATVAVRDSRTEETWMRTFDRSPILIGRGPWNALPLDSPAVAPLHGEIWFRPRLVAYLHLTSREATFLDGQPVRSGELVPITNASTLILGPYRIDVIDPRVSIDPDGPSATSIEAIGPATRALAVMANFASPLLDLRRHLFGPREVASMDPSDPYEIVRRLLASGPDSPWRDARIPGHQRRVRRSHRRWPTRP